MPKYPVTAVIVGAGHRGLMVYANYALEHPDELRIVGVADPNPHRREQAVKLYGLSSDQCFSSAEELAAGPKIADAVINGTMDQYHVPTSLPLLAAGYDMLLEKPIATSEAEMMKLVEAARQYDRKVMVCHVLRYAPFYMDIRERVARGDIGEIISIETVEHVSYHHMAVGFVRGKWANREQCGSPMLMAKCCHDLDIISWMKSGVNPVRVSSLGYNMQFRPEKAPIGSGKRCLLDCSIENECLYSARKHYIDHPDRWGTYSWAGIETIENPTIEQKIEYLKTTSPYGRCVWHCDNNVVDHQTVTIEYSDGCIACHNMVGGTSRPMRAIHLIGTIGEIQGILDDSRFVVRHIDPRPGHEYSEDVVDLSVSGDISGAFGGHAGGDLRLAADFVRFISGDTCSIACTTLQDSINGHLIGYRADTAYLEKKVIDIN